MRYHRAAVPFLVLVALFMVLLARAAGAQDATHVCDPGVAGGYVVPADQPCHTPVTPAPDPTKFCLGYSRSFPMNEPCPRPPVDTCTLHPEEIECNPVVNTVAPVADVTPPSSEPAPVAATAPISAPAPESASEPVPTPHKPVYSPKRAPKKRVQVTTTTTEAEVVVSDGPVWLASYLFQLVNTGGA